LQEPRRFPAALRCDRPAGDAHRRLQRQVRPLRRRRDQPARQAWHQRLALRWPGGLAAAVPRIEPGKQLLQQPPGDSRADRSGHLQLENPRQPGTLNQYRADNKEWQTIYSAYVGGPLIKYKLFLFLAAETTRTHSTNVEFAANQLVQYNQDKDNKFYGKLDWNITDNNVLELTALKNNSSIGAGTTYSFDTDTLKSGPFVTNNDVTKDNAQF